MVHMATHTTYAVIRLDDDGFEPAPAQVVSFWDGNTMTREAAERRAAQRNADGYGEYAVATVTYTIEEV